MKTGAVYIFTMIYYECCSRVEKKLVTGPFFSKKEIFIRTRFLYEEEKKGFKAMHPPPPCLKIFFGAFVIFWNIMFPIPGYCFLSYSIPMPRGQSNASLQ